ncbi:plastocyanin/azurin family copper-binding protein [Pontibacter fetidus]|uniref:Azurin n=1 Tax=Pontibacter fetidus TaxID=2700082 RepID=A0A6B2H6C9_9BACT|nr:plastocyanin/azurin family copper-binding protein [Pontibacter fetidus]NDK56346.1 azurin [Pontibacter fetidus]
MKLPASIASIALACLLAACNNTAQPEVASEEARVADTAVAQQEQKQDTTLQPVVELILRATGDTPEDMAFDQDTLEVEKDAFIKLSLVNEGTGMTMIHNFVLVTGGKYKEAAITGENLGATENYIPKSNYVVASTPLALPGQTVIQEFNAPPPGTYDFVCTYPEHWPRMHGKLIVK